MVAHLLLERLINSLLTEMAEQGAHTCAHRPPGERDEEQQPEQQPPEPTPDRPAGGAATTTVRGMDVVFALPITGDRSDLIGLNDQPALKPLDGPPRLLGRSLIRIANCHQSCHVAAFRLCS